MGFIIYHLLIDVPRVGPLFPSRRPSHIQRSRMPPCASKRAKTTAVPKAISDADGPSSSGAMTTPKHFIPFQTGPSLDRIPDDVLHEILSYLPTIEHRHGHEELVLVRVSTLRVLSRTSSLLRSRCLAMAWQNVTFSGTKIPNGNIVFFKAMGDSIKTVIRVLKASPHLLPLVQFVYNKWG